MTALRGAFLLLVSCLTEDPAVYAFIRQGMNDAKNIIIALADKPIPSQIIVKGIQAIGGMGLMNSKIGRTKRSTDGYQPISQPSGTPMNIARNKPEQATCKLTSTFVPNVAPSGFGSVSLMKKVLNTVDGAGIIPPSPKQTIISHISRNAMTVKIE